MSQMGKMSSIAKRDRGHIQEYRTPSGALRYRVRVWVAGQRVSASFADLAPAQTWRDEVKRTRREAREGQDAVVSKRAPAQTLVAFVRDRWWEEYARVSLAERTRKNYYSHFKRLVVPSPLGALDVTKVDAEHIHEWQAWARRQGANEPSIRTAQKVISAAYTWGAKMPRTRGVIANPVSSADWPEESRTHTVHVFGPEILEQVRVEILRGEGTDNQRQRDALLLSVMAQTGMRPSEARELQVHNVGRSTIKLDETKTDKPRTVPLWAPLRDDIEGWVQMAGLGPTNYLVSKLSGDRMSFHGWENWRDRAYKPARNTVAKRIRDKRLREARAYDLCRHSYAAQQLAALMSLPKLAKIMGHSEQVLARHYSQELEEREGQDEVDPEQAVIAARRAVARRPGGLPHSPTE